MSLSEKCPFYKSKEALAEGDRTPIFTYSNTPSITKVVRNLEGDLIRSVIHLPIFDGDRPVMATEIVGECHPHASKTLPPLPELFSAVTKKAALAFCFTPDHTKCPRFPQ